MKRSVFSVLVALALCLSLIPGTALAANGTWSGKGTSEDPYLIEDVADLQKLATEVNYNKNDYSGQVFQLESDLDLSNIENWTPIGEDTNHIFRGTFNGNNKTISGMKINVENSSTKANFYCGLFGYIGNPGTVQNLTVNGSVKVSPTSTDSNCQVYVGGIVGNNNRCSIQNCQFNGSVEVSPIIEHSNCQVYVGGIVGYTWGDCTIQNCQFSGSVSSNVTGSNAPADYVVGGVAGGLDGGGSIINSCNTGSVSGTGKATIRVGGVAGGLDGVGSISNSYNTGRVSGKGDRSSRFGGVAGYASKVSNSYNTGRVSGDGDIGGVVGSAGSVSDCFYLTGTASQAVGADNSKAKTGEISATAFTKQDTFTNWSFDGENPSWVMGPFRPLLSWEAAASADGSENSPYQIASVFDLEQFRDLVNNGADINGEKSNGKYSDQQYQLVADLQLNEEAVPTLTAEGINLWTPIGTVSYLFQGTFDGNGHTISGLAIDVRDNNGNPYGLFGWIKKANNVQNSGIVKNLAVSGTVSMTGDYVKVGGIVGYNKGTIQNCQFSGSVSGTSTKGDCYVGGVAGDVDPDCIVSNCYNTGSVSATINGTTGSCYVGGVAGCMNSNVSNCYNTGSVSATINGTGTTGKCNVGGVAGFIINISNCYNTGSVSLSGSGKANYVGGVAGSAYSGSNCFYLTDTASTGIGNDAPTDDTTSATKTQFASGEIAWKLQGKQGTQVWGQALTGTTKDAYPVLTANTAKKVYQVDFQTNTGTNNTNYDNYDYAYTNSGGTVSLPTTAPAKDGYGFNGWFTAQTGGTEFTADTKVNNNTTVYSQWTANHYTVTFDKNAADATDTMEDQSFTYDAAQTLAKNKFQRSGYTFAGWATSAEGEVEYADEEEVWNLTATANGKVTLYAKWTAIPPAPSGGDGGGSSSSGGSGGSSSSGGSGGGSSSGGSSSTPSTPSTPSTSVTVPVTSDTASVEVKADVSKDGTATVEVSDKQIEEVASNGSGTVTVDVSGVKNVESVQVPSHVVETTNQAEETGLTVSLPTGSVALDETALDSVSTGEDVTVSVKRVPATDLNEQQQAAVGDMANIGIVVDVDISVGDTKQSTFNGGKLTISVPYTPKKGEDPSKMTVWYIKDDGTIQPMGGYYDTEKKCFVFETTHLSRYVIVSVEDMPTFTDVPADAYYADAVTWAVLNGITTGMTETTFGPDLSCTRAQIVTFLWRAAGQPEVANVENPFSDVAESDYFYNAVLWAVENKITTGTTATTFAPEETCTRAQAAAFLYRNEQANGGGFTDAWAFQLPFTDVPAWCYEAVAWCYMNGVTQGTSETTFSPNLDCSRAQIVTMLYREDLL